MRKVTDIFVSAVLIADDQRTDLSAKIKQLSKVLKSNYANYEILVIDNGLAANQLTTAKKLLPKLACIRLIQLSRKHDTDTAVFAGLETSIGDTVCVLYKDDPIELLPDFVDLAKDHDLVFGVAKNLERQSWLEALGARLFYGYSKRYLHIDIPNGSTYFIAMNRSVVNAITRSGRYMRHIRHTAKLVGFSSTNYAYELPSGSEQYSRAKFSTLIARAVDLVSNYSSHPLRAVSYFGIFAGFLNIIYAAYVVIVNLASNDVEKGWTTLSLQSSAMFFILFMILAVLAEYIGKILNETQQEPPYHVMQEFSSTTSIADETRRNVTK